jgi:hypothetical protein
MTQLKNSTNQLTTRELDIIHLLYRFRFLTRSQIQHFLHHKDHKTIQLWLNKLISSDFITTVTPDKINQESKTKIYLLAEGGVKYLISTESIDHLARQRLRKDSERSAEFIQHQLLLADIALDLEQQNTTSDQFEFHLRADFKTFPAKDILEELKPNAYLVRQRGDRIDEYLLEIVTDTFAEGLRALIKRYLATCQSCDWEETGRPFPVVQLVCPNERTLYYLAGFTRRIAKLQDLSDVHVRFTTLSELKRSGIRGPIWSEVNCTISEAN